MELNAGPVSAPQAPPRWLRARNLLFLLAPLLLWWVLKDVPFEEITAILGRLDPAKIVALALVNLGILLLFNSRWWLILLLEGHRLPFLRLAVYRLGAFTISYFTPGAQFGGEPLQVLMLHNRHGIPAATALGSVTLDKLFDLLANFTFLTVGILLALNGGLNAGLAYPGIAAFSIFLFCLPLGYLLALWFGRFPLSWAARHTPRRLAERGGLRRLLPLVASSERQISALFRRQPWLVLWALLISGLTWVALLAEYRLALTFLGLDLNLVQAITALTAARLAFLTPLPAGLGALEASQVLAMEALGLDPALGLSLALLIRGRDLMISVAGLGWLAFQSRLCPGKPWPVPAGD